MKIFILVSILLIQTNEIFGQVEITPGIGSLQECGQNKICLGLFNCKNGSVNTDGENLIDVRTLYDEKPCPSILEVCCSTEDKRNDVTIIGTDPSKLHKNCGLRHPDGVFFKTIGKVEAMYGEFPWMIVVLKKDDKSFLGGGSLIHPQVVLTAAHIVRKYKNNLLVRGGEYDSKTTGELYPVQDREVFEPVLHPDHSVAGLYNDVALLFLSEDFVLNDVLNTVCLPPPNFKFNSQDCFATGWGKDKFGADVYANLLQYVKLGIVQNNVCEQKLRTKFSPTYKLHDSFICAHSQHQNADSCKGDGGGPLVCPIAGKRDYYYQAGITAFGVDCTGQYPGVYANVAHLREWIDEVLESRNFDSEYFTPK